MTDRWRNIDRLFAKALEQPPEERAAFLDEACGTDDTLREEVEKLLESHDTADTFLEEPANVHASNLWRGFSEELLAEEEEPVERTGQRVGAWRLIEELGRGGMGVVYLAERVDGEFEQRVALKLVKRGMDSDAILDRFRNERRVLAALQHPYIARLYDGGVTEEGTPWFAMEFIEGLPITDYCEKHALSVDERLDLVIKVCRALSHAHNRLIVHRDLKPSNIMVTEDETPRLLDFGLAKVLQDPSGDPSTTRRGQRWMTLDYASPEMIRGDPVGTPSDTYQLGLILYQLLTGRQPYTVKGLPPTEAERVISEIDPPKPSTTIAPGNSETVSQGRAVLQRKRLRGDLDTIVMKALHKDPDRGYASGETMANDLERHLENLPILARPDTFGYRAKKFVQRHRWPVLAGALVVLTLLGGMAGTLWQAHVAKQQRDQAEEAIMFLDNLFEAIDNPAVSGSPIRSVRDMIDLGAERVESAFLDSPAARAQMMVRLGTLYAKLDEPHLALPLLKQARMLARTHGDTDTQFKALGVMGSIYSKIDDYASSFETATTMERLLRETQEAPSAKHGGVVMYIADNHWIANRPGLALETIEQGVELARSEPDLPPKDLHEYLYGYGVILRRMHRFDEAEAVFREALELDLVTEDMQSKQPGVQLALADVAFIRGDAEGALAQRQAILDTIGENPAGENSNRRSIILGRISNDLLRLGRLEKAIASIDQRLDFQRSQLIGQGGVYFAQTHQRMGMLLVKAGRTAEALPFLEKSVDMASEAYGQGNHSTVHSSADLGDAYRQLGRLEKSEAILVDAVKYARSYPRPYFWIRGRATIALAELRLAQDRPTDTLELIDEILNALAGSRTPPSLSNQDWRITQDALETKARVLDHLGRTGEAKAAYQEAIEMGDLVSTLFGIEWPQLLAGYAHFLTEHNDPEAQGAVMQALETSREIYGDDHPLTQELARRH